MTKKNIPLPSIFAKPQKDQLRISPNGKYLAWRGGGSHRAHSGNRVDKGPADDKYSSENALRQCEHRGNVFNIFIQKCTFNDSDGRIDTTLKDAKQITFYQERDACSFFIFTPDEKSILYLRETERGSEHYHLFAVDLDPFFQQNKPDDKSVNQGVDFRSKHELPPTEPRNLIKDPNMTCAMGFVGGIQLWTPTAASSLPSRSVFVSTAQRGPFSSFWDISRINVDTGDCVLIEQNIMSTWTGRSYFIFGTIISCILSWVVQKLSSINILKNVAQKFGFDPPGIPIQWFPDDRLQFRGKLEVNLSDLGGSFCARERSQQIGSGNGRSNWKTLHHVPFKDLNLQLIGSKGGSGTARMEFLSSLRTQNNEGNKNDDEDRNADEDIVDVHLCNFPSRGETSDTTTYERFNIKTGQHIRRLAGNPKSDISGFVVHPKTGQAQCVRYEWEKPEIEFLPDCAADCYCEDGDGRDDSVSSGEKKGRYVVGSASNQFVQDLNYVKSFFEPSMSFHILSRTIENDSWVIYAESDVGQECCHGSPGGYFLFTRKSFTEEISVADDFGQTSTEKTERKIELVFPSRPELSQYQLARMEPVHIRARDGEDILCYLSSPPNLPPVNTNKMTQEEEAKDGLQLKDPRRPPPLVVIIHGGPQARDTWGFDPLCQLLCNRGFRTLQVNYRGSTGFGSRFLQLGMNGQFYQSLQDDIVDAVRYASNSVDAASSGEVPNNYDNLPWGDSDQLAILGGSFGGYSALWGMTFQPGLYKCAVAISPITAVGAANEYAKKAFGGSLMVAKYWRFVFGDDVSDKKEIAMKASPLFNLDKMMPGSSVALYHGENDPRAPIEHSNRVVEELKKFNTRLQEDQFRDRLSGEYVTFAGEGHGISKEPNVLYMYGCIEKFLREKLGVSNKFGGGVAAEHDSHEIFNKSFAEGNTATVRWLETSNLDGHNWHPGKMDLDISTKKIQ